MNIFLAQTEAEEILGELGSALDEGPSTPQEAIEVITDQMSDLWTSLLTSLPIIAIGLVVFLLAVLVALGVARGVQRGITRASPADPVAARLLSRIARAILISIAVLFALSVMGVNVGSVITVLAVFGFAVGLAIQGILQNFVAGVILLLRKPFRAGDQIVTGEFEGTVEDIDFRITKLIAYDGTVQLIPNGQVYDNPLINLTTLGKRRTTVTVGVDYRDDHDAAREVITAGIEAVDGVLDDPAPEVLLTELADSSVNFEIRYWTKPDIRSVRHTQDRVLAAAKTAIEEAGMTIPWPIRTLVVDGPVRVDEEPAG